jgi:SNF2 family DNA or RNA helicase
LWHCRFNPPSIIGYYQQLIDSEYSGDFGKFEQIIMRFETLKSENHKVLIFSTFVKHLRLLADWYENEGWKYAWLTGSTPAAKREDEINKFRNEADVNCFFISLKAGGVGLNLTAADYVFIIDPWWNPASEMQALSRSHRIGQDKNVMVYRFISSETIEEKIRILQENKSKLAETFVTSNNPIATMNANEVAKLIE